MDAAIQRVSRAPTAEELERKRQLAVAAEERKAARAAKEAEKAAKRAAEAAAAEAAAADEDEEEDASESDGAEHRIERLLVRRCFSAGRASRASSFFLVKWGSFAHADNTWEAAKHMHSDAIADYDRAAALPAVLSELLRRCWIATRALSAGRTQDTCSSIDSHTLARTKHARAVSRNGGPIRTLSSSDRCYSYCLDLL